MITAKEARKSLDKLFHLDEIKETGEFENMMNMLDASIRAEILQKGSSLWVGNSELENSALVGMGKTVNAFDYIPHLIRELESLGYDVDPNYSHSDQEWGLRINW